MIRQSLRKKKADGKNLVTPFPVCCPEPVLETTSKPVNTCKDPFGNDGQCIQFKKCPHLFAMYDQKPISPRNRQLLRDSKCDFINNIPYVCCSNEPLENVVPENLIPENIVPENVDGKESVTDTNDSQMPEWFESLKSKLSDFKECGRDAPDRILGGSITEIDEFPWTVRLEYRNGKLFCNSIQLKVTRYLVEINNF